MAASASTTSAGASPRDIVSLKRLVDVLLFVGPSGCGKTTIINQLQQEWPHLFEFSVSHTTRPPRQGEVNGKHYHFVSLEEFQSLINAGAMIEYSRLSSSSTPAATVTAAGSGALQGGNMYGTSKESLHRVLNQNRVVLMDTDLLGAINIRRYCAHVVIDSKPVTASRKEKRITSTTPAEAAAVAAALGARDVEVLPAAAKMHQPAVAWQAPNIRESTLNLPCHEELPPAPPVSSMPNASRLVRCMVIFIAPPSMTVLASRLRGRKSETDASFRMRMDLSVKLVKWAQENQGFFDYYIVNDDLQQCYQRVKRIVEGEVLAVTSSM